MGGMGFKEFNCMNLALLAKQAWRLMHEPEAFWVRTVEVNLFSLARLLINKERENGFMGMGQLTTWQRPVS